MLFVVVDISAPVVRNGNLFLRRDQAKRKGLQLALEPLNGRGIAGYVPQTVVVDAASEETAPREESYML
ncbi:hypothetical protein XI08_28145 [Bradyrhizobium sp. CCBAU 11361]|nr:hypothetical protein [Bradyrhizobium sp. CCBAU 11361]